MSIRGVKSVAAAALATGLVGFFVATGQEPLNTVQAVPVAPGPEVTGAPVVQEAVFVDVHRGEGQVDRGRHAFVEPSMPVADVPASFDPFNAPTPSYASLDGVAAPILPVGGGDVAPDDITTAGTAIAGSLLAKPVNGRESSQFGMRFHPILRYWKLHTGLDWAAPCGTPIGAAADGTVVRVGWAGGNGFQVKIDHGQLGGYRIVTTYNHVESSAVRVGQTVKQLQAIARVGNNGNSTGCHLHFEVIANGQFTDPKPWLNGVPTVIDLSAVDVFEDANNVPLPSPSPSASASPSLSPSASPSLSPSASPSLSPSASPSVSPTVAPSSSPSPSASPVQSPSPSDSPSQSPSASPSDSPSSSPTPTQSPEPSTSTSPEPSDPPSADPEPTDPPQESPTPTKDPEPTTPAPTQSPTESEEPTQSPSVSTSTSASASASEEPTP